jgi:hypothetical protein
MAKQDEQEASDHQPLVETPQEISTPKAADKAGPDVLRAAMAQENAASTPVITDEKERAARAQRAQQMSQENSTAAMPLNDDDERAQRAARQRQMAQENAGA